MGTPVVSIITPSYNSKKHIAFTIDSVLNQTFSDFEMLIVDDCSTDGSADFIESILPDERFKLVRLDKNVGAAEARNHVLRNAKGRYIAFLDSDDIWDEIKLETQVAFMLENNCAFSYTAYKVCNDNGSEVYGSIEVPKSLSYGQYLGNTIIGCLTVMLDSKKFSTIQMPNLRSSHDMALWADLLKTIDKAYGINTPLATYRLVGTSNTANKWKASKEVWAVYRGHLNLSIIDSSYYFVQYAFNAVKKRFYK